MKLSFSYSRSEGGANFPPLLLLMINLLLATDRVPSVDARTVRPISSRRIPFVRNSRNAAKEAYAAHLENEFKAIRRQLYTSQNTCTTLRKRCEDQRKETLRIMSSSAATSAEKIDMEEDKEQLMQQKAEIERLQLKLRQETQQFQEQVEKLTLLEAEMKEIKEMKVQSDEAQVKEYEEKLEQSQQTQIGYEKEIQLLTLKLEAAGLAAEDSSTALRAEELQSKLQSVREKYSTVLNTAKVGGYDEDYQKEIEKEMDHSIQLALESTLKGIEKKWATQYAEVEKKLTKMSYHVESLESERDAALSQLKASISSSSAAESNNIQLKEELTLELTESLTKELTNQLTAELKEKLAKKIERKYKKKYKQMQKELEEQKATSEQHQPIADLNQEQRQKIEAEISAAREQCELDYQSQLIELQKQSDERVRMEKDRMRKLVRALLEREAKKNRETKAADTTNKEVKKKKVANTSEDNGADEVIRSSSSSRGKKQSRKGLHRPSSF